MRMAPKHVKRKFWWELIFISLLLYLLIGVRSQKKGEVAAAAQTIPTPAVVTLAAAVEPGAVGTPLLPTVALK